MAGQPGVLVLLVGLFGSGKSTYAKAATEQSLARLVKTYTTRAPRTAEERANHSAEYDFVTEEKYRVLKTSSCKWDERTADGAWYGVDIAKTENAVMAGATLILTLLPHMETVIATKAKFSCPVTAIYINVPIELANERVRMRGGSVEKRLALQASLDVVKCSTVCDRVFTSCEQLQTDLREFCKLIASLTE